MVFDIFRGHMHMASKEAKNNIVNSKNKSHKKKKCMKRMDGLFFGLFFSSRLA